MADEVKNWYVLVKGEPQGPFSRTELQLKLDRGEVGYFGLVFRAGLSRWIPVAECPEFERRVETVTAVVPVTIPQETAVEGWVILRDQKGPNGKNHLVQIGP